MTGPGGNAGPGNLKQKIRKDYCSVSLSLSQVADLGLKKKINYGLVKKIKNRDFCSSKFGVKNRKFLMKMNNSATCDNDKLTEQSSFRIFCFRIPRSTLPPGPVTCLFLGVHFGHIKHYLNFVK